MSDPRYRDDPARPTDPAYRDPYVAPARRSTGGWGIGAVIIAIIIIAAIVYGYNGTRTNVASNTTAQPTTGMNAPAPMAPTTPALRLLSCSGDAGAEAITSETAFRCTSGLQTIGEPPGSPICCAEPLLFRRAQPVRLRRAAGGSVASSFS